MNNIKLGDKIEEVGREDIDGILEVVEVTKSGRIRATDSWAGMHVFDNDKSLVKRTWKDCDTCGSDEKNDGTQCLTCGGPVNVIIPAKMEATQ